jgi:uncharacterized protein (TIGR03435 family)
MKPIRILIVVVALTGIVYGQAFEVASIRESDPAATRVGIRSTIEPNPSGLTIRNTTLREAIRWAYDEPGARVGVLEGPEWADTVRYDIAARPAAASSTDQLRVMLRALLAARFKLVVRAERKENAVHFLTIDPKGHKLRPSKTNTPRRMQPDATGLAFENVTMSDFQQFLSSTRGVNQPVINRTGLDGPFDFKLAILTGTDTEEARKAAIGGGNLVVFADALKEVGLRLDPGKVPIDVITIESAERSSEN